MKDAFAKRMNLHLELISPMVQLPFSGGGATFSPSWPPLAVVPFAVIAATVNELELRCVISDKLSLNQIDG